MYPSILSFETINKLKLFFECGIPRPQDVGHLCLRYCMFLAHFIISITVLENVPPDAGLQKRATFSTLNVVLAGTGNQTRATCAASSGYTLPFPTYFMDGLPQDPQRVHHRANVGAGHDLLLLHQVVVVHGSRLHVFELALNQHRGGDSVKRPQRF
jgi:hypothetical protein